MSNVRALALLTSLSVSTAAQALELPQVWMHNDSLMDVQVENSTLIIKYNVPSKKMQGLVTEGTELFRGTLRGNRVIGISTIFSSNCGQQSQPVEGYLTKSGSDYSLKLTGLAPSFDRNCRVNWVWNGNSDLKFRNWNHD